MVPIPDELWTIRDFAEWFKVSIPAVRGILRRRELPPEAVIKVGRRVRLKAELVKQWVLRRQSA